MRWYPRAFISASQPEAAEHCEYGGRMYVGYLPMILAMARSFLTICCFLRSEELSVRL